MGSSNSTQQKSSEMNKCIASHQKLTTNSDKVYSSTTMTTTTPPTTTTFGKPPLKGILKNKQEPPQRAVKIVELYVQNGNEWRMERLREDELEKRKKELKADKTVKRLYTKPTHDDTFLHFKY